MPNGEMPGQGELHAMDVEQQLAAMGLRPEQEQMPTAEQAPAQSGLAEMGPHQDELHTLDSEQQMAAMGLTTEGEQTSAKILEPEQIAAMEAARQRDENP